MTESSNPEPREPSLVRTLLGFNQYVVGITLLCYVTGFVITNLYLGSLGVVSFDVLRVRYITTGLLFVIFLGIILFPLYGLLNIIRGYQDRSSFVLFFGVIEYSFERYLLILVAITFLGSLAGSTTRPPIGIPELSEALPLSNWYESTRTTLPEMLPAVGIMLFFLLSVIAILIFMVLWAVNPKRRDGTRPTRREELRKALKWMTNLRNIGRVLVYALLIYLFVLAYVIITNLLAFVSTNEVRQWLGLRFDLSLTGVWFRFVGAAFLLYTIVAMLILFRSVMPKPPEKSEDRHGDRENDATREYSYLILIFALIVGVVVPTYSLSVYPQVPQQIGGGGMVRVEVVTSNDKLEQCFSGSTVDVYLVDRASGTSLFLLVDKNQQHQRVVEVANSQIQSVTYKQFPQ